jgi:hypothetical protein
MQRGAHGVNVFNFLKAKVVPSSRRRRRYGTALEAAVSPFRRDPTVPKAPRLQALRSRVDPDGHDSVALWKLLSSHL